ncbi:glucan biosynthesis protein [Aureimonas mangrovi]|uniref:glucan biosynthesis protein n=1 Tax=Aureimonas mangrovi TaxID=2758041 RepID=UPI001FE568A4|nr:glucan biosynthesis protein G [Aureimonas mangrovi]
MKSLTRSTRRETLKLGLGGVLAAALALDARAQDADPAATPEEAAPTTPEDPLPPGARVDLDNFSFDALSAAMRERAAQPYVPLQDELPEPIAELDYDGYRRILFRRERTVWANEPGQFQLQAFYPGFLYRATTRIHVGDGQRFQLLAFSGEDFEFLAPLDADLFRNTPLDGVAGFRLTTPIDRPDLFDEVVSFLGASYFRALGRDNRYGLSARGIALNTATTVEEEFPRFSAFYLVRPGPSDERITIFAELDSPSVTGAYAFTVIPGQHTIIEVTKRLYFRNPVERLGVAPLTSMYFYGENNRRRPEDFRPEVHDSDGLMIVRASGERVWRPLKNPTELALSYFGEASPRLFGLLQRDREFASYQDVEARYDVRPSLTIEPLGDWGRGVVQLVEIPTNSEANDNIVAFWVPEERPAAGSAYEFRYRMRWGILDEDAGGLAMVTGTYAGVGGNAADTSDNPGLWRFEINFDGGTAASLPMDARIEPLIDVGDNARLQHAGMRRMPHGGWRLSLELEKLDSAPVELRAKLTYAGRTLSETWLYQWTGAV